MHYNEKGADAMLYSGFAEYLFHYMLQNHFKTKKRMAETLGITYRTLLYNFKQVSNAKGGNVAFVKLVAYCLENGFSLDRIHDEYTTSKKEQ